MIYLSWLYDAEPLTVALGLGGFLLVCAFVGMLSGHYERQKPGDEADQKSHLSNVLGAMLGLMALLLGFTFALAAGRFEARQKLVVREANAIGTALLRAEMLPSPLNERARTDLESYIMVCSRFGRSHNAADAKDMEAEFVRLQRSLWKTVVAAEKLRPEPVPTGQFVSAMNDLIDLHGERVANRRNRVPTTIYILLFFSAGLGHVLLGLSSGIHGRRLGLSTILTAVLVSGVVYTILDLDRPLSGLLVNDQSPIEDLRKGLQK
ncbi:MAG: hypothetical protein JNJ45_00920 [Chthonomonas sp.]|nr:hypothetical protein [Chthonomonas sp.]